MKEIGGYFEFETLINNEFYKDLIPLNTARSALLYIMKAKNIKKIYIPLFLCNVIVECLRNNSYEIEYYNIDKNFKPIFSKKIDKNEYMYIVNYYGQLTEDDIEFLKEKYSNIILDNTHAFFQRPILNIDTIYTCRKYFGVPDGAYLSTDKILDEVLENDVSMKRMEHLIGRFENSASDFYKKFIESDEMFRKESIKHMSKITHNILGAIDYKNVIRKRQENYEYLNSKLMLYNKLKLVKPSGPFAYPLLVNNGELIKKEMAKIGIYIPTLWPNVLDESNCDSIEYKYALNILPIPCDQRYEINDMKYIVEKIKKFI